MLCKIVLIMRLFLLCNGQLGLDVIKWLREQGETIIGLAVHPPERARLREEIIAASGIALARVFDGSRLSEPQTVGAVRSLHPDMGISVLFGYILRPPFLDIFPKGVINLHPAFLPYNRGAYPNVWSIVERTPAGATLHYVDPGVDTGDIIAQIQVEVSPVDDGASLYRKLEIACANLFSATWPKLRDGSARRTPQPRHGTVHRAATSGYQLSTGEANAPRVQNGASNFLSWLILIAGVLTVLAAGYLSIQSHSSIPFWDEWDAVRTLAATPDALPMSWLLAQHNEHRHLLFRLLLLADLRLFRGRHVLLFASMPAIQLAFVLIIGWLLRKFENVPASIWRSTVGLAAFCLFCPSQVENFAWAFQVSFFVPGLCAMLAFASVALYRERANKPVLQWTCVAGGIIAAALATFSNANGMLIWPLLIAIGLALRLPWKILLLQVLTGLTVVLSYFVHYIHPLGHASPLESIRRPWTVIEYLAKYFGGSFPLTNHTLSVPLGLAGLIAAAALAIWAISRGHIRRPSIAVLFGLMSFALATAFITALGRINFGTDQAFASRYQTYALLFWFCIGSMLLLGVSTARFRALTPLLLTAILVIMGWAATRYKTSLEQAINMRLSAEVPAMALMTGVPDYQGLKSLYPRPDLPWRYSSYLRNRQISIFATDSYRQLNARFDTAYRVRADKPCMGFVDSVEPVTAADTNSIGLRLSGWAVDGKSRWPIRRVIVVSAGRIVGFAEPGISRPDVSAALSSKRVARSGWKGYANVSEGAQSVDFYGILRDREVCPLRTVRLAGR
jgi:folate-dependent phosphoribosylglycinamide formyltransferase PurN